MRALVSVKFFWFLSEYFWISSWIDFGFLYENLLDFWVKSFGFWVKYFGFLGEIFWIFWWFFTLSSLVAQWQWVAIGDSRIVKEALLLIIATSLSTLPPANFLLHWLSKKGGRGANPGWGMREKLNLFDPAPSLQHENHNHHCKKSVYSLFWKQGGLLLVHLDVCLFSCHKSIAKDHVRQIDYPASPLSLWKLLILQCPLAANHLPQIPIWNRFPSPKPLIFPRSPIPPIQLYSL